LLFPQVYERKSRTDHPCRGRGLKNRVHDTGFYRHIEISLQIFGSFLIKFLLLCVDPPNIRSAIGFFRFNVEA
jgi:hypothetical protein